MQQLQEATTLKMNALMAEELELRRQLGHVAWAESFSSIMHDTLAPMNFVDAWDRQAALKQSLYPTLGGKVSTKAIDDVKADLVLVGGITVTTERAAPAVAAAQARSVAAAMPSSPAPAAAAAPAASAALPPRQPPAPAVERIWASALGGGAAAPAPEPAPAPAAGGLARATAALERARASLAAVESTAAALPRDMRAQQEQARAAALARVAEAEAAVEALQPGGARPALGLRRAAAAGTPAGPAGSDRKPAPGSAASAHSAAAAAPLEQRLQRFSLRREAERRRRQRLSEFDPALAFHESGIVTPEQAATLYAVLPFGHVDDGLGGATLHGGAPPPPPTTR